MIRNHWIWHPICYDIAMIASRPLATGSDIVATPTKVPPKGKGNLVKQKLMARWMWISGNAMRSMGIWMSQWAFLEKHVLQWCKGGVHICAYLGHGFGSNSLQKLSWGRLGIQLCAWCFARHCPPDKDLEVQFRMMVWINESGSTKTENSRKKSAMINQDQNQWNV
jgi:hypothetical protein